MKLTISYLTWKRTERKRCSPITFMLLQKPLGHEIKLVLSHFLADTLEKGCERFFFHFYKKMIVTTLEMIWWLKKLYLSHLLVKKSTGAVTTLKGESCIIIKIEEFIQNLFFSSIFFFKFTKESIWKECKGLT